MVNFHVLNEIQQMAMKRKITLFSSFFRWFTSKYLIFIANSKSSLIIFVRRHFRVNFSASYKKNTNKFYWWVFSPLTCKKNRTIPVVSKVKYLIHSSERCSHWFELARKWIDEYGKTWLLVVIWKWKISFSRSEENTILCVLLSW